MFGLGKKESNTVAPTVTQGAASEAPFRMEFAPGLVLIEAEIRDRRKLAAFVAALNAISILLPEDEDRPASQVAEAPPAPAPTPAIAAPADVQPRPVQPEPTSASVTFPPPSLTPTRTIDLTRDPPTNEPTTFAPATSPTPGPAGEKLTAPPPPPAPSS